MNNKEAHKFQTLTMNTAMIPYQAAAAYGRYRRGGYKPFYNAGMKGFRFAYNNRGNIYRYAKRFSRSREAKRNARHAFKSTRVGNAEGPPSKSHTVKDTSTVLKSTRTLYSVELTEIQRNTTTNDMHRREGQVVFIKGFKICLEIENQSSSPLYFNYAIIAPRCGTTVTTNDFFRGLDGERSVDFSLALSSQDFHCRAINSDKYTVLKHKKLLLACFGSTNNDGGTRSAYEALDMWVPLNRQIRYEDVDTDLSCNPVFMVYWMDKFTTTGGSIISGGTCAVSEQVNVYFKN